MKSYFKKNHKLNLLHLKFGFLFLKENGNILLMGAILMPVALLLSGMVLDLGRAFVYKEELNRACMIAAEEAAKEINMDSAQMHGNTMLQNSFGDVISIYFYDNIIENQGYEIDALDFDVIDSLSEPKYIRVSARASIECVFLKTAGIEEITINSEACGRLKKI